MEEAPEVTGKEGYAAIGKTGTRAQTAEEKTVRMTVPSCFKLDANTERVFNNRFTARGGAVR
jgi:hypothetical protein